MEEYPKDRRLSHVTAIVAAYLGNPSTKIEKTDLGFVIRQIDAALCGSVDVAPVDGPELEMPSPAAIRRSVTAEALVSFVDGKKYKSLKRHLAVNGYTPQSYRERFGLKADYPMTAPTYSARRSEMAKNRGLGQSGAQRHKAGTEAESPVGVEASLAAPTIAAAPVKMAESGEASAAAATKSSSSSRRKRGPAAA